MVRGSVAWFSEHMERKLQVNDHKGDWGDYTPAKLIRGFMDEVSEMMESLVEADDDHIIEECADAANWLHFIADVARRRQSIGTSSNGMDGTEGEDLPGQVFTEGYRGQVSGENSISNVGKSSSGSRERPQRSPEILPDTRGF